MDGFGWNNSHHATQDHVSVEKSCYEKACPGLHPRRDHLLWVQQQVLARAPEQSLSCRLTGPEAVFMEAIAPTLICAAEPYPPDSVDATELTRSLCGGDGGGGMAGVPFQQDMFRRTRRVRCHQEIRLFASARLDVLAGLTAKMCRNRITSIYRLNENVLYRKDSLLGWK